MAQSDLEAKFSALWAGFYPDLELVQEYQFAPPRRWRFDFAHHPSLTAIEVEGGVHIHGRHNRGTGFEKDCEKYLEAAVHGWQVIRVPGSLIDKGRIPVGKTRDLYLNVLIHRIAAVMRERMKQHEAV